MIGEMGALERGLIAAAVGAGTALAGTALVRALALRLGIVNHPNPLIPQHTRPVAYLGGVGVGLGVMGGVAAHVALGGAFPSLALTVPALLYLGLGVVDDLRALSASSKFILQSLVAALAVAMGLMAPLTGILVVDAAASWLWIVTLVNAFNLTDVCDGLLSSLCAVMFTALAILDPAAAPLALAIAGASLGFLVLNRPPALIFLGDAGSHLLGFLAAALTLGATGRISPDPITIMAASVLLAAVPVFELIFLIVARTRAGRPWWQGSPDHFSLRLQASGYSRGRTDLIAAIAAAIGCGAGLALPHLPVSGAVLVSAVMVTLAMAAGADLLRRERDSHREAGAAVDVGRRDSSPVTGGLVAGDGRFHG